MTTPDPHTNTPIDLVPHLVPDLVPEIDGAHVETTSSPVPSSSIGDEVSEPPRPRPTTSSQHQDDHPQQHPLETASNLMDSGRPGPPHGGAESGLSSAAGELQDQPDGTPDREHHEGGEDQQDDQPLDALGVPDQGVHGGSVDAASTPGLTIKEIHTAARVAERDAWQNGLAVVELAQQELEALLEYSTTLPTGKTIGKRWKRRLFVGPKSGTWVLGEYVEDPDPAYVGIRWREIRVTS